MQGDRRGEESHAERLCRCSGRVAELVEKEFPDVLSNRWRTSTRSRPRRSPRDNVLIRLTIECSYIQPLDGEQNQKFADIEGYKLSYLSLITRPTTTTTWGRIRTSASRAERSLFRRQWQSACLRKEKATTSRTENWLLRVMWEPHLDGEKLIDEFSGLLRRGGRPADPPY